MGVRLPTILGKAIDDVVKTLNDEVSILGSRYLPTDPDLPSHMQYDEERVVDLTEVIFSFSARRTGAHPGNSPADLPRLTSPQCISRMEDLMDDLHANSKLRPIIDDGEGDIPLWNKMIARYLCVSEHSHP